MQRVMAQLFSGLLAGGVLLAPVMVQAAEGFRLSAPDELVDTGLLKYVLPRFSLKTGVRIEIVDAGETAEIVLSPEGDGTRVFAGPGATWRMQVVGTTHEGAVKFADWLTSEIGQRTVTGYEVDGAALFTLPAEEEVEVVAVTFDGDAIKGRDLSVVHCARCHAVSEETRMNSIGSTPSFFLLRGMRDWDRRFQSFYVLAPHPAFTQVAEVTPPFPEDRPSPIAPVEITLDDLEAILAFVAGIEPADLGAPIQHQ